jgi:hypothetical protein
MDRDPWHIAVLASQDAWEDDGFQAQAALGGVAMNAPMQFASRLDPSTSQAMDLVRRAASALFHRPWIDEEIFRAAYGPVENVVPMASLGLPAAPERRRRGASRPRTRVQGWKSTQLTIPMPSNAADERPRPETAAGSLFVPAAALYQILVRVEAQSVACESILVTAGPMSEAPSEEPAVEAVVLRLDQPTMVHLARGMWTITILPSRRAECRRSPDETS